MKTHLNKVSTKDEHKPENYNNFQIIKYQGIVPVKDIYSDKRSIESSGSKYGELSVMDIFTALAPEPGFNSYYTNLQFALLMYFNQNISDNCIIEIKKADLVEIFDKLEIAFEEESDLMIAFESLPESFIKSRGYGSYLINPSFIKFSDEKLRKSAFMQFNSVGSSPNL